MANNTVFTSNDFIPIAEDALIVGEKELEKEFLTTIKPSAEAVRQAGLEFCRKYEESEKVLTANNKKVSRRLRNRVYYQNGTREAFDNFQNAINLFFGQLVKVMYVYMAPDTGAVTLSVIDNSLEGLQINNNRGTVEYHLNEIRNIFKLSDYDSTILDITEQSIYARWQVAKATHKKKAYLPILWNINGVWGGAKVNNLGTIAEAYVNFYLARFQFLNRLEEDVAIYILNSDLGAVSVDNASGFLIGDTSLNHVQFAVKKDTASPMNIKRVYEETKKIINDEIFQPEKLWYSFVTQENEKKSRGQAKQIFADELANTVSKMLPYYKKNNVGLII